MHSKYNSIIKFLLGKYSSPKFFHKCIFTYLTDINTVLGTVLGTEIKTRKPKKFKCMSSQGRKIKSCQRIDSKGDLVHVVLQISRLSRNSSFLCNTPYLGQNRKYKKHTNLFYHINKPIMTSTRNKLWISHKKINAKVLNKISALNIIQ